MPQTSTLSPGAITSRSCLPRAAARSEALGGLDEVAARFLVRLELDEAPLLRFLEEIGERLEPIVGLIESGLTALERLLDHRAPDLFARAALGDERVQRLEHQVERLLLLVFAGGRRFAALLRRAALLLVLAHQVVVVNELIAVGDQEVRARVLDADADHGLRVLAQL